MWKDYSNISFHKGNTQSHASWKLLYVLQDKAKPFKHLNKVVSTSKRGFSAAFTLLPLYLLHFFLVIRILLNFFNEKFCWGRFNLGKLFLIFAPLDLRGRKKIKIDKKYFCYFLNKLFKMVWKAFFHAWANFGNSLFSS